MTESEALMTGKGCEQVTSEDCLGKDRSQALRYTDCAVVRSQGIGLRWVMDVVVTGIQILSVPARV